MCVTDLKDSCSVRAVKFAKETQNITTKQRARILHALVHKGKKKTQKTNMNENQKPKF